MLDNETKQRINSARQILVGKVPDPKAQVEQITTALIYKFMDDMDRENEELGGKATFFTGILKEFAWGKLMSRSNSGEQRWDLYTRALVEFSKAKHVPELFRTIFKGAFLPYRDPETLNLFLKEISGFSYGNSENLGNAFEYLLSILGSQGDAGQFRTPRHIIDFIVEVVDPGKTDRILDPACGTAGFLISAYKHIQRANSSNFKPNTFTPGFAQPVSGDVATLEIQSNGKYRGDKLSPDDRKRLTRNIVGYDISPDMVRLSLVNMYLHGFPTPEIFEYDSLTYEERWDDNFDVILANPPFMTPKGGIRPHSRFQVSANRSEVLFVDYITEHLTINGKAGIIVPEGIIFQSSNAYKDLRKWLVEENFLWAVVSLPAGVFQPYSGVKTSILFFDKQTAKKSTEILFVKIENDGFDLGAQRRRIDKNDLPDAYRILRDGLKGKKLKSTNANWVKKSEIAATGDYNLTGDRYREAIDYSRIKWPIVKLGDVCEIVRGSSPRPAGDQRYYGGNIPRLMVADVTRDGMYSTPKIDFLTKDGAKLSRPMKKGELVMAVSGQPGVCTILNVDCCIHDGFVGFRHLDSKLLPEFAYYVLMGNKDLHNIQSVGAVFKNLKTDQIRIFQIPLPPIEVQQEIVAELKSYQCIIDGAMRIITNWKPRIKIDPDWPMVKLGDVCDIFGGGTPARTNKEYWGGDIPWISSRYFKDDHKITGNELITKKGLENSSSKIAPKDSTILITRVSVGKYAIADKDYAINQDLTALVPRNEGIHPKYLWLISEIIAERIKLNATGIGVTGVTREFVVRQEIPLPSIENQMKIVSEIEKEQKAIVEVKKLIGIHELKIKEKIAEVWGE